MLPFERQELINTLSNLPTAQIEQILFVLDVPGDIIPTSPAPKGERVAALLTWVEKTGSGLTTFREVLYQVIEKELPEVPRICPYKGLSYFDCNDEDYKYFYGREALIQTLIEKVTRDNFLAIVGASGSGKSSVLRAGLLQRLKDKGKYEIRILVPGEHPLQSLALAFVDESAERLDRAEQQAKAKKLIKTGAEGLCALAETSEAPKVVLLVDQFEESFTLCQDIAERQTFFEILLGALEAISTRLCLILAMRSDFVGKCFEENHGGLAEKVKDHLQPILPMIKEELVQAITEPARQAGISIETGLTEDLLEDLEQSSGKLPLLQYTLTELWHRQQDNQLRLSIYHQLGGVTGTLKQQADQVFASFTPEQQRTVEHIFLNLTQIGEGAEYTRRRVTQANLVSSQYPKTQVVEVIQRLADANLVVTDGQDERLQKAYGATVDVVHEALIRNWPRLRKWLDDNHALLRQKEKIELAAEEWIFLGRKKGYLLQGEQLSDAKKFERRNGKNFPLSKDAKKLIQESIKLRRVNLVLFGAILILPFFVVDGFLRNISIKGSYASIYSDNSAEVRRAVMDLTLGCPKIQGSPSWIALPKKRFVGNCESLTNQKLDGANLRGLDLSGVDLRGADLNTTILEEADLSNANLSGARLTYAKLQGANLSNANLTKTYLGGAYLNEVNFSNALLEHTDFVRATLSYADFSDTELSSVNFPGAIVTSAKFHNAIILNTSFLGTNLFNTNLSGADLSAAKIQDTSLNNVRLCNTILPEGSILDPNRNC